MNRSEQLNQLENMVSLIRILDDTAGQLRNIAKATRTVADQGKYAEAIGNLLEMERPLNEAFNLYNVILSLWRRSHETGTQD